MSHDGDPASLAVRRDSRRSYKSGALGAGRPGDDPRPPSCTGRRGPTRYHARMLKTRASREFWLLAVVALLILGTGLGLRDPWPSDEPRFTLVARHMVESGDWLFPRRGTELYSDKPPMLMWFEAAFYTLVRDWRVAFLLPSLLAALGTLWCVYDLGRRLWTRRVGLYAAWALLFVFQFTYQSKKAQIDPLVCFWITLANYGLLRHLLRGPDWRMWTLGWFAAGLGTITKGVGGLALLMILPAAIASLRGWPGVRVHARNPRFWIGPLAFAFAAALWLVPMVTAALHHAEPEYRAYLNDILFRQTAGRYAKSWDHPQPPWYHFEVMAFAWLPTVLALFWAIPAWRRRLRRRDARYLLPLAWWALIILFFSIPHGKRDVYIMPALPMMCLALGPLLLVEAQQILERHAAPRAHLARGQLVLLDEAHHVGTRNVQVVRHVLGGQFGPLRHHGDGAALPELGEHVHQKAQRARRDGDHLVVVVVGDEAQARGARSGVIAARQEAGELPAGLASLGDLGFTRGAWGAAAWGSHGGVSRITKLNVAPIRNERNERGQRKAVSFRGFAATAGRMRRIP